MRFGRSACDSAVSDVEAQCVRDEADVPVPGLESASQRGKCGWAGPDREGPCVLLRPWGLSVPGGELSLNDDEWQKEDTVRSEFQEGDCAG